MCESFNYLKGLTVMADLFVTREAKILLFKLYHTSFNLIWLNHKVR